MSVNMYPVQLYRTCALYAYEIEEFIDSNYIWFTVNSSKSPYINENEYNSYSVIKRNYALTPDKLEEYISNL